MLGATIIMVTALKLQQILKPYQLNSNNKLEINEIITGAFTIFASIIFNDEENNVPNIDIIIFIAGIYKICLTLV